jgi:hypothetical protein
MPDALMPENGQSVVDIWPVAMLLLFLTWHENILLPKLANHLRVVCRW